MSAYRIGPTQNLCNWPKRKYTRSDITKSSKIEAQESEWHKLPHKSNSKINTYNILIAHFTSQR